MLGRDLLRWFCDGVVHRGVCVMSYCLATTRRWEGKAERFVDGKQVCIVGMDWTGWFLFLTEMRPRRDLYCLLVPITVAPLISTVHLSTNCILRFN
jgi:hypothetical protein